MNKDRETPVSRNFGKLDSGIVESSLWVKDHDVLRVWIYMLARANAQGYVSGSAPSVAHQCLIQTDRFLEIIEELSAPDPHSRTATDEGRRIRAVPGGWQIINHETYRNDILRGSSTERVRRYREKNIGEMFPKEGQALHETNVTGQALHETLGTQEEEEEEEEKTKEYGQQVGRTGLRFEEFWSVYPRKEKKKKAMEAWKRRRLDVKADAIIKDVAARADRDPQWLEDRSLIPHPTSYLNAERWTDEWDVPQKQENKWAMACRQAKERGMEPFKGAPYETPEQFMVRVARGE